MVAQTARTFLLKVDNTGSGSFQSIGSLRGKSLKINAETVDVTNSDSTNQYRELLAGAGVKSLEVSGNGIFGDDTYVNTAHGLALNGTIRNWQIVVPGLGTYQAAFQITAFEVTGEYNGAVEFTMSLASSGDVTFTAS